MEAVKISTNSASSAGEEGKTFHEQEQDQDVLESASSVSNTPTLQRKNSQRRLRIPTEDHQLFLADLNEDVLPYIKKCRQINDNNSSDDENEFPAHATKTKGYFGECQREPDASTSNNYRIPQTCNGYNNTAKPDGSWTGISSQFLCSSKFQQYHQSDNNNNNGVSNSMDSAAVLPSEEPIRRSKPANKAYNSPKKSALNGDNCTIA